jgi:hypothetical protein
VRLVRAFCFALVLVAGAASAGPFADEQQVHAAREKLLSDENLQEKEAVTSLKWMPKAAPRAAEPAASSDSLRVLFESIRIVVWVLGAGLLLWVLWRVRQWWSLRPTVRMSSSPAKLATHVRDLDIRPQQLPARVGPAVWALWQAGETRAALSLLYRATLSRLVHEHGLKIGAASTEGDCLRAANTLPLALLGYVEQIITLWRHAVYGARLPDGALMERVCRQFDDRFPAAAERGRGAP